MVGMGRLEKAEAEAGRWAREGGNADPNCTYGGGLGGFGVVVVGGGLKKGEGIWNAYTGDVPYLYLQKEL